MKKKVLGFMMCFCLMAGVLNGCAAEGTPASDNTEQADDNGAPNESNNADAANTAEPTAEPTPEPTPEPTLEPENKAFAEELNIQFSEPENLSLPCYEYIAFESNNGYMQETNQLKVRDIPAEYSFQNIEKGEPDADGNVTYTIVWDVQVTHAIDVKTTPWEYDGGAIISEWALFDYYTGTFLSPEVNSSNELNITWDDNTYHISYTRTAELIASEWIEENQYVYMEWKDTYEYRNEITVPADYDGLVLYIDDGYTKEDFEQEENSELGNPEFGTVLHFEETDDKIFIRVSDCIQ